jgi:hypothetical protein
VGRASGILRTASDIFFRLRKREFVPRRNAAQ